MSWIKHVPPELAEGQLKNIYGSISSARRHVAAVHQVQSLHPAALQAHWELYKSILTYEDGLQRITKERIGVLISEHNGCDYCKRHHGEALRQLDEDTETRLALEEGRIPVGLPDEEKFLLRWALRVSAKPELASETDIEELRAIGFSDREILDVALTVSYFNFITRLVEILGVQLEPWFGETCGPVEDRAIPEPKLPGTDTPSKN